MRCGAGNLSEKDCTSNGMIAAIVAVSNNNVIGNNGKIPWRLKDDQKMFKEVTSGNTVIMGRKTYESILGYLGKPLPNRQNIIITRQSDYDAPGCEVVSNVDEAILKSINKKVFIIGGEEIYRHAMPHCHKLYVTHVDADVEGDAYFPQVDDNEWVAIEENSQSKDDRNNFDFKTVIYERR